MEGEAVAAVLQVLVQNLIDHSKKEISLIRGLDKEAEKLTGTLHTIQKFLNDAETRTIPGDAVKSWLEKLENAAFDADNVLDELNYHLLSKQIKPVSKKKVLSCFFPLPFSHITRPRKMALRIKEINGDLESIHKEAAGLGLEQRLAADGPTLLDASFETAAFIVDPIFIGRDDAVSEIVRLLLSSRVATDEEPAVLPVLAIVGMGGLGKTTLTRKVFHHQTIKAQFGSHIWVHVSQIFDPINLLKKILSELTPQVQVESKQDVLKKIREAFKVNTYLLVLDDVWNQDLMKWEDFINSLLGATSTNGNAVVVTSRSTEVASVCNPFHTHELKGLSEEDCWSIIKAKAFRKEDVPSKFEAIGRKIARRCHGLPLAANVVGGLLYNKSREKWLSIQQKWLSHVEGENITKILKLSYNNLSPPSLKKCFAYCSTFPKGHRMNKRRLMEYWMAEGFLLHGDRSNDMESAGEEFINVILHNSLLQPAGADDYGDAISCGMHDLVHDLASSVLGSPNAADSISRVRYMAFNFSYGEPSPIPNEVAKHLRTLFGEGYISGTNFSDFERLHVLTFQGACQGVHELPSSIRKLIHLRHLDISGMQIEYLPDWIGELYHLLTLRADHYEFWQLPSMLTYLSNLRHLYVNSRVELPIGIGRLIYLQTLTHFSVGEKNGCNIEELGSLNNLRGRLSILNLERVGDKEDAEKANLLKKSKLWELHLGWSVDREDGTERNSDEGMLEGLQPHSHIKKLQIRGFKGKKFPSWTQELANLTEIILSYCFGCEEIPTLGHLPNLKSLLLNRLSRVQCVDSSFYRLSNMDSTRIIFPALERLELINMPKLAKWEEADFSCAGDDDDEKVKVLPRLQHLGIVYCGQLTNVPAHFSSSSCLQHLEIGNSGIVYLPHCLFTNNPNLSRLQIGFCPKLRELPQGLCTLHFLEELIIEHCPELEGIAAAAEVSEESSRITSLRHLKMVACPALPYLPCELVGPLLEKLFLMYLGSVTNLPSCIDSLARSPLLRELIVSDVPNFSATGCAADKRRWSFRSLARISIGVGISGGSIETVDAILRGCGHSLDRLSLTGMESWAYVPEAIRHLTALSELELRDFGVEELPEWLENLSSLKKLEIFNCNKLRHMYPMDPELSKISHIPKVRINGYDFNAADAKRSSEESSTTT